MIQKLMACILWCLIFTFCLPAIAIAQPDPCTDPFLPCPIDGGLIALLIAGVLYGFIKYKSKSKEANLQSSAKEQN